MQGDPDLGQQPDHPEPGVPLGRIVGQQSGHVDEEMVKGVEAAAEGFVEDADVPGAQNAQGPKEGYGDRDGQAQGQGEAEALHQGLACELTCVHRAEGVGLVHLERCGVFLIVELEEEKYADNIYDCKQRDVGNLTIS